MSGSRLVVPQIECAPRRGNKGLTYIASRSKAERSHDSPLTKHKRWTLLRAVDNIHT
jgi:hypothetical protein